MKHIFVVNPSAGSRNYAYELKGRLAKCMAGRPYEIYETQSERDATAYVRKYCEAHPDEQLRFCACGGDGTIYEVANGIVGYPNASMTCLPCGSGNDFVKYYGGMEVFDNLPALLDAEEHTIDLIRVNNGMYCVNAISFGFTTAVCRTMLGVRRKKLIGGKNAYYTGVVKALVRNMKNRCVIRVDGEVLNPDGAFLLCSIANGQYEGGSFRCAPNSNNEDGLMEVCMARPVSRVKFVQLAGIYQRGEHLTDPKFKDIMVYRQAKRVTLDAPDGFAVSVDGEIIEGTHFDIEVVPHAIRFAVPRDRGTKEESPAPAACAENAGQ